MANVSLTMMLLIGIAAGCATEVETSTTQQQVLDETCVTTFYSDDTLTTPVGTCRIRCSGSVFCSGTQTDFFTQECLPCGLEPIPSSPGE